MRSMHKGLAASADEVELSADRCCREALPKWLLHVPSQLLFERLPVAVVVTCTGKGSEALACLEAGPADKAKTEGMS